MIQEDYVSFETAKLLKEKGFDLPCHATYDTAVTGGKPKFSEYEVLNYFPYGMKNSDDKYSMVISAPTLQMAMKWLREEKHYYIQVMLDGWACGDHSGYYVVIQKTDSDFEMMLSDAVDEVFYQTYEEACEAAIKYCIENLI